MKILIIEDQLKLAKMLKDALEREGYAADYLTDGISAQKRIELHHSDYDVVVLDLMLPKRSGEEVCRNVRKQGIDIPIIILTAKDGMDDKVTLLDSGADDYLVKPFSLEELLARIRALVRRPNEVLPSELKVNSLRLNPNTKQAFHRDKELPLTLKEFRLLEYFMRRPNQAVEREELITNLWGFDYDSFSNVVDVHINNLRKKLKESGLNSRVLESVRGVGYRMKI